MGVLSDIECTANVQATLHQKYIESANHSKQYTLLLAVAGLQESGTHHRKISVSAVGIQGKYFPSLNILFPPGRAPFCSFHPIRNCSSFQDTILPVNFRPIAID